MSVVLKPCPFCEGPPVPFVRFTNDAGKIIQDARIEESDDGIHARAQVFCHECGAEGPSASAIVYVAADVHALTLKGIEGWNTRDARHRDLYDYGVARGLQMWPRAQAAANDPAKEPA